MISTKLFEQIYKLSYYNNEPDFSQHEINENIEYKKGWIQKRNPEPEKLHNKFKKAEKNGIECPFAATIDDCGFEGGID